MLVFRPSRYLARVMRIDAVQRQSVISLASTLALTAIGFLSTMYFAHTVGPAILGAYYLFVAYFSVFNLIGDGGFGGAAVKRISEGEDQNAYFTAFALLRVALVVVSVSFLLIAQPYLVKLTSSGTLPWLILALVVSAFTNIVLNGVYGRGKVGINQIGSLVDNLTRIGIQVVAIVLGYGLAGLTGGFVAGLLAAGIVNFRFLDLKLAPFCRSHIQSLFAFSFWTFLSSGGYLVFSYADTIMIGYFMTDADIGIYRVALQLTSIATFTTVALHTTLYPKISYWGKKDDLASVERALARAFTYSLLLAVPVVAGGWILGERLLYFFYGASFSTGAGALAILLFVQVASVFMYLQTMCLNALDRPKDSFRVTAVAVTANVVLNILLIPAYGIVGAALATLVTMVLNAALSRRALSRSIRVRIEPGAVGHIVLAALVMVTVVVIYSFVIPLTNVFVVLGAVALGGLVYLLVLLKTDRGIRDELKELIMGLGIPWPGVL
ncbi:stage V sporulation protein B [Methanoculleus chikugoensis]|jgi:O-antigen/teichoic acid export membrane protein|uniref:Stage V sporulation protein B n=1 Tax=Methanoculleus chikugoensis TaxID=118126 RepID=A0A1M4MLT8_9EURY|nr:flippase [Methanoculleus chikugoensis]MDD4567259.1 flippase [Methanoculleus chikugoensis]SCL75802.1 stage V sporulation protein B [Methanoculleus chikugoensis]